MTNLHRAFAAGAFFFATLAGPTAVFADSPAEVQATAEGSLGTVVTSAVTAPITEGDITYIPGIGSTVGSTGGASGHVIGTVMTAAVTAPITEGDITYIPF